MHGAASPRYAQIASILRGQIVSGELPVGSQLPTIEVLHKRHGVTRTTVRQALQVLAADSLVSSERGRGTFVIYAGRPFTEGVNASIDQTIAPMSPDHGMRVLGRDYGVTLPQEARLGGVPFEKYVRVRKVHSLAGAPYSRVEVYIFEDEYRRFPKRADEKRKMAGLLRDYGHLPLKKAREELTIRVAEIEDASALACDVSAPVVRLIRVITTDGNRVLYASVGVYRGDRFRLEQDVSGFLSMFGK